MLESDAKEQATTQIRTKGAEAEITTIGSPADLGRLVRKVREGRGLSQQEFADLAGVGRRFLSELENGKPTLELGKVLAKGECRRHRGPRQGTLMDAQALDVRLDGFAEPIGVLARDNNGAVAYAYRPDYVANPDAVALSLSLPLTDEPYGDVAARPFFDNLLQERDAALADIMAREGLARDDIAGLLFHLGKDCAGALSALPAKKRRAGHDTAKIDTGRRDRSVRCIGAVVRRIAPPILPQLRFGVRARSRRPRFRRSSPPAATARRCACSPTM